MKLTHCVAQEARKKIFATSCLLLLFAFGQSAAAQGWAMNGTTQQDQYSAMLNPVMNPMTQVGGHPVNASSTEPRKSADPNTITPAPCPDLCVDSFEPLYLDADARGKQGIHLHGNFPPGTTVQDAAQTTPLVTVEDVRDNSAKNLLTQDLYLNVTLTQVGATKATIYIKIVPNDANKVAKVVPIDVISVSGICASKSAAPSGTPPAATPATSSARCPTPDSNDRVNASCSLPKTFAAFNAMTRKFTDNGNKAFCDSIDQSQIVDPAVKSKSLYKKEGDVVPFIVCNKNPFLASSDFSVAKTPIANDDLSTFLGILVPGLGAGKAASSTVSGSQQGAQPQGRIEPLTPPPPDFVGVTDAMQECLGEITTNLDAIDSKYADFRACFSATRKKLLQSDKTCDERLNDTKILSKSLSGLNDDVNDKTMTVNGRISKLQALLTKPIQKAKSGPYANGSLTKLQLAVLQADNDSLASQACISGAAADLVSKAVAGGSWIDNILGDTTSFVEETDIQVFDPTLVTWSVKSSPPAAKTAAVLAATAGLNSDPYGKCSQTAKGTGQGNGNAKPTPNNGNQPGSPNNQDKPQTQSGASDLVPNVTSIGFAMADRNSVSPWLTPHLTTASLRVAVGPDTNGQNDNNASQNTNNNTANSQSGKNNNPSGGPTAPSSAGMTYSGTYTFGAPRIVVSAGVAAVVGLPNRQYQKVQAQGQSSGTTIEYSTNSSFRMSPLITAHGRLYQYHEDNSIWATLGVTASSNNSGVSAEYFLGLTSSFLHNWVFLTPGLYIGQSQTLTGGYKVGDQLPASFTGSLPVQQNYKPGFGLAISFRVPGTSAPKTKTTNQNGDSTTSKNSNGGKGSKGSSSQ
jgi:hypothetical protein